MASAPGSPGGGASDPFQITSPAADSVIEISGDPAWPAVLHVTNVNLQPGQLLTWQWHIQWLTFSRSGVATTATNQWDAAEAVANLGGLLKVTVTLENRSAAIALNITGTNPDAAKVLAYLSSKPGSAGFEKILQHETKMLHFDSTGHPKKSFDNGFGMCQLTNPTPTFEQVWNWQHNIDAALALFAGKRNDAMRYLSQGGRSYTDDQLKRETVSRWNGGPYHALNSDKTAWVRNPTVLCDSQTGNIGWDMTNPDNTGKSEAVLHQRDAAKYKHKPGPNDAWRYFGICYADRILD